MNKRIPFFIVGLTLVLIALFQETKAESKDWRTHVLFIYLKNNTIKPQQNLGNYIPLIVNKKQSEVPINRIINKINSRLPEGFKVVFIKDEKKLMKIKSIGVLHLRYEEKIYKTGWMIRSTGSEKTLKLCFKPAYSGLKSNWDDWLLIGYGYRRPGPTDNAFDWEVKQLWEELKIPYFVPTYRIAMLRILPEIIATIKDKNKPIELREETVKVLDEMGWKPSSIPEKIHYFVLKKHWDNVVEIGRPAVKSLIEYLLSDDWRIRYQTARVLGEIGDKRALKPLTQALNDNNKLVQIQVAAALVKIGETKAIQFLARFLYDKSVDIRYEVAEALGDTGDKKAVKLLIQVLKYDVDWGVRWAAADALYKIKDKRAIRPLIDCLKNQSNESWQLRRKAAQALSAITGENFGEDYNAWLKWWNEEGKQLMRK